MVIEITKCDLRFDDFSYWALGLICSYASETPVEAVTLFGRVNRRWRDAMQEGCRDMWRRFYMMRLPKSRVRSRDTYHAFLQLTRAHFSENFMIAADPTRKFEQRRSEASVFEIENCNQNFCHRCPVLSQNLFRASSAAGDDGAGAAGAKQQTTKKDFPTLHCDICLKHVYCVDEGVVNRAEKFYQQQSVAAAGSNKSSSDNHHLLLPGSRASNKKKSFEIWRSRHDDDDDDDDDDKDDRESTAAKTLDFRRDLRVTVPHEEMSMLFEAAKLCNEHQVNVGFFVADDEQAEFVREMLRRVQFNFVVSKRTPSLHPVFVTADMLQCRRHLTNPPIWNFHIILLHESKGGGRGGGMQGAAPSSSDGCDDDSTDLAAVIAAGSKKPSSSVSTPEPTFDPPVAMTERSATWSFIFCFPGAKLARAHAGTELRSMQDNGRVSELWHEKYFQPPGRNLPTTTPHVFFMTLLTLMDSLILHDIPRTPVSSSANNAMNLLNHVPKRQVVLRGPLLHSIVMNTRGGISAEEQGAGGGKSTGNANSISISNDGQKCLIC